MLPSGHTHIDVDQMFLAFSIWLNTHSVECFEDLVAAIDIAYKKENTKPTASFLPMVFNWIGFFAPFTQDVSGLNSAHAFLFRKLASGKIGMKVKQYHSTSPSWMGSQQLPNEWIVLLHQFPTGFPELIHPTVIEDMLEFDTIRKYNLWLTAESLVKWETYLQEPKIADFCLYKIVDNYETYSEVINTGIFILI